MAPHALASVPSESFRYTKGSAELCGPDDPLKGVDADRLRQLLRHVYESAGGVHEDWAEYDRVMAAERRAAVLVTPQRIYQNP